MRRSLLFVIAVTLVWLVAAPSVQSQFGTHGEISGYVRIGGSNQVPDGTVVSLHSDAGEIILQMTPEGSGHFQFRSLRRQVFYVTAKAPGYREVSERADLVDIPRVSLQLTLLPQQSNVGPQAPPKAPPVDQRKLRIPDAARKEFERGAKELVEKHNFDAGLSHVRKAIEIYPDYYEAYLLMGTTYMDEQKWPEAEEALKHCLKIDNQFAPCYGALGAVYNRQGKPGDAMPLLQRAVELEPNAWQGHFDLAQSFLAVGKILEAEAEGRRAHDLQPKFPLVHVVLANIVLRKNDLATARREFQHYLDLAPNGPLAGPVKDKIKEIDSLLQKQSAKGPQAQTPKP